LPKPVSKIIASAVITLLAIVVVQAQPSPQNQKDPYPAMAPLDQYLMPDQNAEIALARTAAPASISGHAEVMVLTRQGYVTAAKGSNGFLCIVERGWAAGSDQPDFWNPRLRAPICFNAAAARSFVPIFFMRTKLALAGKSKSEIAATAAAAIDSKELPPLEPGAMCYMMSKQQYLNDEGKAWHPHLMFIVPGDVGKTWGANQDGSPVLASNDPEERATIFLVLLPKWSDGTPGPPI